MSVNLIAAGSRIKHIRKKHNYSMASFAKLVGNSSPSTVNNWEKGNNLPKKDRLEKIAILGNTSVDWIKYGDFKEYILQLLYAASPTLTISDDQLEVLLGRLQKRSITYEDDLQILTQAKELFPELFSHIYENPLPEPHALIAEGETQYTIEKDHNYRNELLPLIEVLSKDPHKYALWRGVASLLIAHDQTFIHLLQQYINTSNE